MAIDQDVFRAEWAVICERFNKDPSAVLSARYFQAISRRMDTEEFRLACARIFESWRFFPSPDDFPKAIGKDGKAGALEQWELCQRVMEGEPGILDRMSPAGRRVVSLMGGDFHLRNVKLNTLPFVRKEFLGLFTEVEPYGTQLQLPEVTKASRQIVGEVLNRNEGTELVQLGPETESTDE